MLVFQAPEFCTKIACLEKCRWVLLPEPWHLYKTKHRWWLRPLLPQQKPQSVLYSVWKKVQEEGDSQCRWKVVQNRESPEAFQEMHKSERKEFREHVKRVQNQYSQMKKLRENLQNGEIVMWMDFWENYVCSQLDGIQSSYWNPQMVTLHTIVAYLPGDQHHKSIVAISDELSHSASTVYAIIQKCVPKLKALIPNLAVIHYLTVQPASTKIAQYFKS